MSYTAPIVSFASTLDAQHPGGARFVSLPTPLDPDDPTALDDVDWETEIVLECANPTARWERDGNFMRCTVPRWVAERSPQLTAMLDRLTQGMPSDVEGPLSSPDAMTTDEAAASSAAELSWLSAAALAAYGDPARPVLRIENLPEDPFRSVCAFLQHRRAAQYATEQKEVMAPRPLGDKAVDALGSWDRGFLQDLVCETYCPLEHVSRVAEFGIPQMTNVFQLACMVYARKNWALNTRWLLERHPLRATGIITDLLVLSDMPASELIRLAVDAKFLGVISQSHELWNRRLGEHEWDLATEVGPVMFRWVQQHAGVPIKLTKQSQLPPLPEVQESQSAINGIDGSKFVALLLQEGTDSDESGSRYIVASRAAVAHSGLLRDLLSQDDVPSPSDPPAVIPVPVDRVKGTVALRRVVSFMEEVAAGNFIPRRLSRPMTDPLQTCVGTLCAAFVYGLAVEQSESNEDCTLHKSLIDVIEAANFLDASFLVELGCACLATLVFQGATPSTFKMDFAVRRVKWFCQRIALGPDPLANTLEFIGLSRDARRQLLEMDSTGMELLQEALSRIK